MTDSSAAHAWTVKSQCVCVCVGFHRFLTDCWVYSWMINTPGERNTHTHTHTNIKKMAIWACVSGIEKKDLCVYTCVNVCSCCWTLSCWTWCELTRENTHNPLGQVSELCTEPITHCWHTHTQTHRHTERLYHLLSEEIRMFSCWSVWWKQETDSAVSGGHASRSAHPNTNTCLWERNHTRKHTKEKNIIKVRINWSAVMQVSKQQVATCRAETEMPHFAVPLTATWGLAVISLSVQCLFNLTISKLNIPQIWTKSLKSPQMNNTDWQMRVWSILYGFS